MGGFQVYVGRWQDGSCGTFLGDFTRLDEARAKAKKTLMAGRDAFGATSELTITYAEIDSFIDYDEHTRDSEIEETWSLAPDGELVKDSPTWVPQ